MAATVATSSLRRSFLLLGAAAALAGAIVRASAGEPANAGRASVAGSARLAVGSPTHDFGTVAQGRTVEHRFEFANTGSDVLRIADVVSSCGCTTVGDWPRTLAPGEKGAVTLRLDTARLIGPLTKNVTIRSNDPAHPATVLELKVTVWTPISISSPTLVFPAVTDPTKAVTRAVTIRQEMEGALTLSEPRCDSAQFQLGLKTIASGKEYELLVTTVPPLPDGTHTGRILLRTSNPKMPEIAIQAVVTVLPPVQVAPTEILFTSSRLTVAEKRYAVLLNHRHLDLQVTELVTNAPGVALSTARSPDGSQITITLAFPAGFERAAGARYVLRGKTNQLSVPSFEIPIGFSVDR